MGRDALIAIALTAAFAGDVAAQSAVAQQHIDEGRRLYRDLDYMGCINEMTSALGSVGITDIQRVEAYEYLTFANLVLERLPEAEAALGQLFRIDPYHPVQEPTGSPKILRFVQEIRERLVPDANLSGELSVSLELPSAFRQNEAGRVEAQVSRGGSVVSGEIGSVTVFFRSELEPEWSEQRLALDGNGFAGELTPHGNGETLELYAEARDLQGRVVAREGSPLSPREARLRPAPRELTPDERRTKIWWIVGILGAVAAGAATAIAITAYDPTTAPGSLAPGRVQLP